MHLFSNVSLLLELLFLKAMSLILCFYMIDELHLQSHKDGVEHDN